MSQQQDEAINRRLAEMKAYLERRITDSQDEIERLKGFLEVVDELLAERSFKRPVIVTPPRPEPITTAASATTVTQEIRPVEATSLTTTEGVHLGDFEVYANEIRVVLEPKIKFDANSPPLQAFLISKVLEPMRLRDMDAAREGRLPQEKVLNFKIDQAENQLRLISVQNYGDDRRVVELRNAVRWTLRRMYEKTLMKPRTS